MKIFHNLLIKNKLIAIISSVSIFAIILFEMLFIIYSGYVAQKGLSKELTNMSSTMSQSVKSAILFDDSATATEVLNLAKTKVSIISALLLTPDGKVFASYYNEWAGNEQSKNTQQYIHLAKQYLANPTLDGYADVGLVVQTPVYDEQEIIGVLFLIDDLSVIRNAYVFGFQLSLVILILFAVVSFLLSCKLQNLFTDPIYVLLNKMKNITESKDFSLRVGMSRSDEIGQVYKAFDHMLLEIEKREKILRNYSDDLEIEVGRRTKELNKSKEKLEELMLKAEKANKSKSVFLANMSHEIRTPLNGVLGMLEIITKTDLDSHQKECLQVAYSSAENLLNIINDILDFSKIEANQMQADLSDVDLLDLLESITIQFANPAQRKNIEIMCQWDFKMHQFYSADSVRIKQIVGNLLNNAIKFTHKGQIVLKAAEIGYEGKYAVVHLIVSDTGVGIKSDKLAEIFNPFSQEDTSTTRKYGGTGLGLTISKQLAGLMHGDITVTSEEGKGTEFCVKLLLEPISMIKPVEPYTDEVFDDHKILVVDDNHTNGYIIGNTLETKNIAYHYVDSASSALEQLEKSNYHLAIIDMHMPRMDGLSLIKKIRQNHQYAELKIIILSSMSDIVPLQKCKKLGVQSHLLKPIKQKNLLEIIAKILQSKNAELFTDADTQLVANQSMKLELSILVAEDNPVNQQIISLMLTNLGCRHKLVENGQLALELFKAQAFDVVLMDCQMPVMDGFAATQAIREYEKENNKTATQIIAVTANASTEDKEECLAMGMDGYLSKPFTEAKLFSALHETGIANKLHPTEPLLQGASDPIIFDAQKLKETVTFNGALNMELLRNITDIYVKDVADKWNELRRHGESQQYDEVRSLAHFLKSSSISVGAIKAHDVCKQIEHAVCSGDYTNVDVLLAQNPDLANDTVKELSNFLASL